MNIIIDTSEHLYLQSITKYKIVVGSRLYGINNSASDTDVFNIYNTSEFEYKSSLPNIHQFQYKDEVENVDYLYTSELQFWKNLRNGDSTINSDVLLFTDFIFKDDDIRLKNCRTYKIIKAYIGFAKRDLKQYHLPKKVFHAIRCLYCAEKLLNKELPLLTDIKQIYNNIGRCNKEDVENKEKRLRDYLNDEYKKSFILDYYIDENEIVDDKVFYKLINSNNIREFKY